MFGLGRLFARRAARKRAIFAYHDGRRGRWIDPMLVEEGFERLGGEDWQDTVLLVHKLSRPAPPGISEAVANDRREARRRETGKLLAWTREIFGIESLTPDGQGLTEVETVGVLTAYIEFQAGLAAATRPLADSPPSTAASPTA